jgi:hypothetical protein
MASTTQAKSSLRGASVETQTAEVSRRTENRLLYDHMYNQLEARVTDALVDGFSFDDNDIREAFRTPRLVKITGVAEIEDYEWQRALVENFNALADVIAYAHMPSAADRAALETELKAVKDGNERAKLKEKLKATINPTALAKALGLRQDDQLLKNLKFVSNHFYAEGFDVVISQEDRPALVFRAVIDKKWLRIDPQLLRSLHAGLPARGWTLVGHVTHVPGIDIDIRDPEGAEAGIHDSYRAMFRTGREFERKFFESDVRTEIVVAPLAIYREVRVERERRAPNSP